MSGARPERARPRETSGCPVVAYRQGRCCSSESHARRPAASTGTTRTPRPRRRGRSRYRRSASTEVRGPLESAALQRLAIQRLTATPRDKPRHDGTLAPPTEASCLLGEQPAMTVRKEKRGDKSCLVIDISYKTAEGRKKRYRRDAQVQTRRCQSRRAATATATRPNRRSRDATR